MEHGLKLEKERWTDLWHKEDPRTTGCVRCAGLLVSDWFYDFESPREYHVKVLRCVQCGHRVDSTIVQNRISQFVVHDREQRCKDERSMKGEHWDDAAVPC